MSTRTSHGKDTVASLRARLARLEREAAGRQRQLEHYAADLREAGDGLQALATALAERPEIVFLDYDMPRLDGVETCRRLRSDAVTAGVTIVMLTGMSDAPSQDRAVAAGADVFLTKPFSPLRLLRLVDGLGSSG